MRRSQFLRRALMAITSYPLLSSWSLSHSYHPDEVVKQLVIAAHDDLDMVKKILDEHPHIINKVHQYDNGEYESPLNAAAHEGRQDIVRYLLAKGAHINLFAMTVLGQSNLVIPILLQHPGMIFSKGAHGFTLLHHAIICGDSASEIYDFLINNGLKYTKVSQTE